MPWFGSFSREANADASCEREAKAVDTGVEMQCRGTAPARRGAERLPFEQFRQAADDRPRVDLREARAGSEQKSVEDIDGGFGRHRAHLAGLRRMRHEERDAARIGKRRRNRRDAAAIRIGFHHRGAIRRHSAPRERLPVAHDRGKLNGQNTAGFKLGRSGGRNDSRITSGH